MYAALRVAGLICQIIAWSGRQIVLWNQVQLRGRPTWAVHSTLVVSAQIRSLDYKKGRFPPSYSSAREADGRQPYSSYQQWYRELESRPDRGYRRMGSTLGSASRRCPQHCSCAEPATYRLVQCRERQRYSIRAQRVDQQGQRSVLVLSVDRKGKPAAIPQEIRHPRPVTWIGWRSSTSARCVKINFVSSRTHATVPTIIYIPSPRTRSFGFTRRYWTIHRGSSSCPA